MNYDTYNKIVKEVKELSKCKNNDYGDLSLIIGGKYGLVIRCIDKIIRLENLEKNNAIVNESAEDTAKDIINYLIYYIMMCRGELNNI